MIDPADALPSFQQAYLDGKITLAPGEIDPTIYVCADEPAPGVKRLTYASLEGDTVTAIVMAANCDPIKGRPCFQLGVAVPEKYRNRGRATALMKASIAELRHGFARNGLLPVYVEAVVSVENKASQRVIEKAFSTGSKGVTDQYSGMPALQYELRIESL